ncbi:hypothetical protein PybrP1_013204 [[Pythium] brassicae (nom. inval.)]|nr:hypothetical protein PybrP1_013204 [[Pythium] brassicae (nom. inval.)]
MATSAGGRKSAPLPYEAALGACVSFAAQVLGSAVPASHVCTKDALGAIVREAHRFGLHAARLWGATDTASSASMDPRKLLKRLQAQAPEGGGSSSPSRLEPLESLAFKDLTWDAHGDADQTLEMELLELETRATEADASVCILLTLHASPADAPASPEAAILWLPASDGRRGDQKKQYLLYVCPGRVKVVKSVAELLKKLRDEIRLMDGRGVGYRVWTLARGPRRHKKKAPPDQATETEKSSPRLSARATESAAQQRRKVDIRPLAEDVRVLPMSVFSFASAPRTAANREETVAVSTPTEMNPSLDEPTALAEGLEPSESSFVEKPLASHPFARQNGYDSATPAVDTRAAQHVATFITVATEAIGKRGNQSVHAEKLAELRRKKLQQLHHRAREEQLLQQQKKQAQPQPTKSIVSNNGTDAGAGGGAPLSKPAVGKRPSNKKLVQNALEYTLLAGGSMEKDRRAALAALARSPCDNFIVLLKSARDLKFRALYEHHADREEVSRLFAAAPSCPPLLTCGAIGQFFKYNSGKKEFVAIDSRSFTVKTDACALKDALVFKKKAGIGRLL